MAKFVEGSFERQKFDSVREKVPSILLSVLIIGVAGGSGALGLFALIAQSSSLYMTNGLKRSFD